MWKLPQNLQNYTKNKYYKLKIYYKKKSQNNQDRSEDETDQQNAVLAEMLGMIPRRWDYHVSIAINLVVKDTKCRRKPWHIHLCNLSGACYRVAKDLCLLQ